MAPNTALEPAGAAGVVSAAAQCEPLGSPTALLEKTSVSRHSTRRMGSFSREVAGDRSLAIEYSVQREGRMDHWLLVFAANGEIQAQQVLAFLEAAGISSELRGESLRKTHGLTLDGLGMVEEPWRPLTKIGRGRSSPRLRAVSSASMAMPRSALLEASAHPNGSD